MSKRNVEVINISDSSDDESRVSGQEEAHHTFIPPAAELAPKEDVKDTQQPEPSADRNSPFNFLKERKKLEAERLERVDRHKRVKLESGAQNTPTRTTTNETPGKYTDGVVKHTINVLSEKNEGTCSIEECFGPKDKLKLVIMSSFVRMDEFVVPLMGHAKVICAQPQKSGEQVDSRNWFMHDVFAHGTYHAKFALIFTTDGWLRVVVTTANFIPIDWMWNENTVFMQDFPLKGQTLGGDTSEQKQGFQSDWTWFLYKLKLNKSLKLVADHMSDTPLPNVDAVNKWDFSRSKARLISSISETYSGLENIRKVGHFRLADLIRQAGCGIDNNDDLMTKRGDSIKHEWYVDIECQGSSLGAYKPPWGNEFYNSACGRFNLLPGLEDDAKALKGKRKSKNNEWPPIKILYPTQNMALNNRGSISLGGNFFMDNQKWSNKDFPRDAMYRNPSKRGAIFTHAKSICGILKHKHLISKSRIAGKSKKTENGEKVTFTSDEESDLSATESEPEEKSTENNVAGGWVYIGSHNFTPSAWGRLTKAGKLNIANCELGVFLPLYGDDKVSNALADEYLTYSRPVVRYDDEDMPWTREVFELELRKGG